MVFVTSPGGGRIKALDEGSSLTDAADGFNFIGSGIVAEMDITTPNLVDVYITGGGASSPDAAITDNYFVDLIRGNNSTGNGSMTRPFATIQKALDTIGQPMTAEQYQRRSVINIAPGIYTENLTVPHGAITLFGRGVKIAGNVIREISDSREFGIDSSTFRGCLTFMGGLDSRDTHNRLRQGMHIGDGGGYRCKVYGADIATIIGDGTTVTVTTTAPYPAVVGIHFNITNTVGFNGTNRIINSILGPNSFTYLNATVGSEAVGSFVETDIAGYTGTTHDTVVFNTYFSGGTFTEDDGVVNGGAPTTGSCVFYGTGSRFYNAFEARNISLNRLDKVEFDNIVIVNAMGDLNQVQFFGSTINSNTFGANKQITDCQWLGVTWTVNIATIMNLDLQSYADLLQHVTWAGTTPTIGILESYALDYVSTVETVARNIYISPTGSDTGGDGSSGNPFFSLHRAFTTIKEYVRGVEINIIAIDGTYNFGALGDLLVDKKIVKGATFSGKIRIKPNSTLANRFTVLDSGTFDNNPDINSNIHTCLGKSWTPNTYAGKFIRVSSMNSGTLPSNGDGINYTYRVIPIVRNGVDWIETSYSSAGSQNFGIFDIVEHKVVFDLGTNNLFISDSTIGGMIFNSIGIQTTGSIFIQQGITEFAVNPPYQLIVYNSFFIGGFIWGRGTAISVSYIKGSSSIDLAWMDGNVVNSTYSTAYGKISVCNSVRNTVWINNSGNNTGPLVYLSDTRVFGVFSGAHKFINSTSAIQVTTDVDISGKFSFENISLFIYAYVTNDLHIYASIPSAFVMLNEPSIGRLTLNGTTESIIYNNLNQDFIATILAPTAIDITAASQLTNDSFISGATIKNALETIIGQTLPSSSFNGTTRISVGDSAPLIPNIGDIWIDTTPDAFILTSGVVLTTEYKNIVCNSNIGFNLTLPTAASTLVGQYYNIKNIGSGNVTIMADVNIDNSLSGIVSQWQCITPMLVDLGSLNYMWIKI